MQNMLYFNNFNKIYLFFINKFLIKKSFFKKLIFLFYASLRKVNTNANKFRINK